MLAVSAQTVSHIILAWVCLSVIAAALFGAISAHGKRRYREAQLSLKRQERHVGPQSMERLP